jgi:hypothetical protein
MADLKDNGQIDYRQRLRDRRRAAVIAATTITPKAAVAPVVDVVPVVVEQPLNTPAPSTSKPAASKPFVLPAVPRTPSEIRTEAQSLLPSLLAADEATYTADMQSLSVDDPMLYAAVVDAIQDADTVAGDKTTI